VTRALGAVMPYWLDRDDAEAVDIALAAQRAGIETVWVGEMASFDAFALATAIGLQAGRVRIKVGPLAPRMSETLTALRSILDGQRAQFGGQHVRAHGFKLRQRQPATSITVAAFGPAMTRVAARQADEVVLNLVTADHVARVRDRNDAAAGEVGRPRPRLAVWVAGALDPGARSIAQLAGQVAVYLGAPGYGEQFARLGFGTLVEQARAGARRAELSAAVPVELIEQVTAIGSAAEIGTRIAAYHDAGADHVGVVPSTAEDPAGSGVLEALAQEAVA
jgi:alkanesulfonate monooxygenase SsuD/methylene tetrahydromethanopterin reductase-like flavin-dependent oxidoreductase (luciferase family)